VEQREDVGDGKAAARGLVAGLSERRLEFGPIGHREAGAVEVPGPVAAPPAGGLAFRLEATGDAIEQPLEEIQRQASAGLDVAGGGEASARQMRQVGAGGVAVEHLRQKRMDGGDGIEEAVAIVVTEVVAQLLDGLRRQRPTDIGLEVRNDARE